MPDRFEWTVVLVRVPSEPARHRIAVWRELRRAGAVPLGSAAWALPAVPAIEPILGRLAELVAAGDGELLRLTARGHEQADRAQLLALYEQTRAQEWAEFLADCGKYLAELDREEAQEKYTLAELEEEEQSFERLQRWHRDLRKRDLLASASATEAQQRLKECGRRLERYSDEVYERVGVRGD